MVKIDIRMMQEIEAMIGNYMQDVVVSHIELLLIIANVFTIVNSSHEKKHQTIVFKIERST